MKLLISALLATSLALSSAFGAAGDIKIPQRNPSGNAWADRIFATAPNSLIGANNTGRVGLVTVGANLSLVGGTLSAAAAAGTTVGTALINLTNPSAITFIRINADNSVTALSAANYLTALGFSANGQSLVAAANYAAMRALLDLEAGTDFLGYPTGTPNGTKFLRDDNSWQTVTPLSDGDKGDITVSGTGATFTIDAGVVTLAKMADLAQDQFIGRTTASTGVPQTATITAAARTALDDPTVSAMVDTLGGAAATGTGGLARQTDPIILAPNAAMGALAVDVTKRRNTKTATAAHTLTFSATPTAGQVFGVLLTGDSVDRVITIPSSYSLTLGAAITSFTLKATVKVELTWVYDGTTYFLAGEPVSFNNLTTVTPATGDYLPLYDDSGAVDGKATIATILALGGAAAPTVNAQTGTTYTLVLGDANNYVTMSNASANTLTVPPNASVAFPTGTTIPILQLGAGATTIDPDAGVTINGSTSSLVVSAQHQWVSIIKVGTNAWESSGGDFLVVGGNIGAATATTPSAADNDTSVATTAYVRTELTTGTGQKDVWVIPIGDETTAITTGTAKVTFRAPYAATVTAVRASLTTASSSGLPTFDINETGTGSIFSTTLTIDASEKTSLTAATAAVISDSTLANDAEITIDVDVAGTGATGAKVSIYVTR